MEKIKHTLIDENAFSPVIEWALAVALVGLAASPIIYQIASHIAQKLHDINNSIQNQLQTFGKEVKHA